MKNPELVLPFYSEQIELEHFRFMKEAIADGQWWSHMSPQEIEVNFKRYVDLLRSVSEGRELSGTMVPATEYWILDEGHFVGHIRFRHCLNERLEKFGGHLGYQIARAFRKKGYGHFALKALLPIAKKKGLSRVLLTCDDTNAASIRLIEKCGGVLQDKVRVDGREIDTRRYWIPL